MNKDSKKKLKRDGGRGVVFKKKILTEQEKSVLMRKEKEKQGNKLIRLHRGFQMRPGGGGECRGDKGGVYS